MTNPTTDPGGGSSGGVAPAVPSAPMGITQAQQMEINQTRLEAELDKLRHQQQQTEQRAAYAEQVANDLFKQRTATPHHHYTAAQGFGHPPPPPPPPMAAPCRADCRGS